MAVVHSERRKGSKLDGVDGVDMGSAPPVGWPSREDVEGVLMLVQRPWRLDCGCRRIRQW